ncbi:hypothetical protein L249_1879 [Ophiocordyceps polyrhachis-furcata BCC 54312]|uniref:Bacteriophage T5 Orf172 DNA-binding domain-containing protein n=1 Tax=Ophiocordyceps polyrhachis-furcata BCC 54312 TaxID=1330021 RepID=A0A367LP90_9HYPO|nr:hypothetical protein L249_1879 [Ophiocordyceps polyrhachis-furcata BCC 54312]
MPFVANTPESRLGRSDSKDPSSTCRGITSSGRPCRRPVPRSRVSEDGLYCWQHKEQAGRSAQSSPVPQRISEHRSSLDTLADRLGLVDLSSPPPPPQPPQKDEAESAPVRPKPKPKSRLRFCFCFYIPIDQGSPPKRRPRPRPRPLQQQTPSVSVPVGGTRPGRTTPASQADRVKRLIPQSLDVATTSALATELSRPYAESEEAGYIYMFWLTPASRRDASAAPPVAAARSLLAPPSTARSPNVRRPSDVVSRFANSGKMLLKIGRAANVQRRMNQWQRQCGHDIEMLRYYPYLPGASDAPADGGAVPRMTPHCRRVERLIHLELAGLGLRANLATCEACGRDHREWFQVEATREAVRSVDEVIRRWVGWDETTTVL